MKHNKFILPLLLCGLAAATGCKKYLEQPPDMRTQLNSVEKVAELLTSAYPKADYMTFMESASDNAEDKGPDVGAEDNTYTNPYMWKDEPGRFQGTPVYYWNTSYEAIAAANQALDAINKNSNDPKYLPYKGEALLARAYAHFMLVTLFAKPFDPANAANNNAPGIPYVTTPEKVVMGQYDRGTVASTYASIEKDLTEGLPLIRNTAYKVQKYHFNVAAANAFAARFYLFKGQFDKVIIHVNAVSNSFKPVIRPWNTRYRDFTSSQMLAAFTQAAENSNLLLIETVSWWARNYNPRYGFGQNINNSLFVGSNASGTNWGHKVWNYGIPNYSFLKWREHFVREGANANIGYGYTIAPVFTTDEALLNRAEAYAATSQFDLALADLNTFASTRIVNYNSTAHAFTLAKIATFYNTADPKTGVTRAVLDAKKAEFVQEGLRWLDIVRHGLPVTHIHRDLQGRETFTTLSPTDPRRLFQLPQEAELAGIQLNPR